MRTRYFTYFLVIFVSLISLGCPSIPYSVLIIERTSSAVFNDDELARLIQERVDSVYTIESFYQRMQNSFEAKVTLIDRSETWAESIHLSGDTLVVLVNQGDSLSISVDSVLMLSIFDESVFVGKLWRSTLIATTFSGFMVLGYIPPNPPEPNTKSFVGAGLIGFSVGVMFADREVEHLLIVREEDLNQRNRLGLYNKYVGALTGR